MSTINGTPGNDFLFGTFGSDTFQGFGGRNDRLFLLSGEDTVVFGTGTADGQLTRTSIFGFRTQDDAIRLVDGAEIDRVVERWYGLEIRFEGEGDVAYIFGFRLDAEDLVILRDDPLMTFYRDADEDGFGADDDTLEASSVPEGYAETGGDADDADASVYPGAPEINDFKDNDQDGEIDEENRDPTAGDDSAETDEGVAVRIPVATLLDNDEDPDGDALTLAELLPGPDGDAVLDGTDVVFTPAEGFSGDASFGYRIADGFGGTADATVTVTVRPAMPPDPPVVAAALVEDTGRAGSDGQTSNPAIAGTVAGGPIASVVLQLAGASAAGPVDITGSLGPDGAFSLDAGALEAALGLALPDGPLAFGLRATDSFGQPSGLETVTLGLDRTRPEAVAGPSGVLASAPDRLRVAFDEPVDAATLVPEAFSLTGPRGAVAVASVVRLSPLAVELVLPRPLGNGDHTLSVRAPVADTAGNGLAEAAFAFSVAAATRIARVSPADGTRLVNLDREITVEFDRPVDPATLTAESFRVLRGDEPLAGSVRLSSNGLVATFDPAPGTLLPASTALRLRLDGTTLRDLSGTPVDGNGDGVPGGALVADFSTVSVTPIPGTDLEGFIYDSNNRGPNGEDLPLVGVNVSVIGLPGVQAVTDATGRFLLEDLPAPDVFLHFDASPVTAETGFRYGTIVKPGHTVPGQLSRMTTPDGTPFDIYFPAIPDGDAQPLDPGGPTTVGLGPFGLANLAGSFPGIDPAEWEKLTVTIPAGGLGFEDGTPASNVTIMAFEPDRIPAPTPPGYDPLVVFTVVADGADVVDGKAQIGFPNLSGLEPGARRPIMSFDHDAGHWVQTGTAVVTADGERLVSEGDGGVNTLGWKFVADNPLVTRFEGVDEINVLDDLVSTQREQAVRAVREGAAAGGNTLLGAIDLVDALVPEEVNPVLGVGVSIAKGSAGTFVDYLDDGNVSGAGLYATTVTGSLGSVPAVAVVADTASAGNNFASALFNAYDSLSSVGDILGTTAAGFDSAGNSGLAGSRWDAYRDGTAVPYNPPLSSSVSPLSLQAVGLPPGVYGPVQPSQVPAPGSVTAFLLPAPDSPSLDPAVVAAETAIANARADLLDDLDGQLDAEVVRLAGLLRSGDRQMTSILQDLGVAPTADMAALLAAVAGLKPAYEAAVFAAEAGYLAAAEGIAAAGLAEAEAIAALEVAQDAYFDAVADAIDGFVAGAGELARDIADAVLATIAEIDAAVLALRDEAAAFAAAAESFRDAISGLSSAANGVRDAIDAGADDLSAFVPEVQQVVDDLTATESALVPRGYESLLDWIVDIRPRLLAIENLFDDLLIPFTVPAGEVFALAVLEDGTELRAKAGAGEPFAFAVEPESVVEVRFFDAESGAFGSETVALGETDGSGRTQLTEMPLLDSDGDGIPDIGEEVIGSSPTLADTDGDGVLDGAEIAQGLPVNGPSGAYTGLLGGVALAGDALDVAVVADPAAPSERTAVVATGAGGLALIDVRDPAAPVVLSQTPLPGVAIRVAVDPGRDLAFVALGEDGLAILDIADPLAPLLAYSLPVVAHSLGIVGNLLLVGGDERLSLVDPLTGSVVQQGPAAGRVDDRGGPWNPGSELDTRKNLPLVVAA